MSVSISNCLFAGSWEWFPCHVPLDALRVVNYIDRRVFLICPVLELFHPFKHLMELTWSRTEFFRCFIAPFVHVYFRSKVYIKPSLKTIESFFTVLRLAYSEIRDEYRAMLTEMDRGLLHNHAQHFFAIVEFFIPLV